MRSTLGIRLLYLTSTDNTIDASAKSSSPTLHAGQGSEMAVNIQSLDVPLPKPQAPLSASHRRGRRKIVKKRTLKDEEGYLGERDNRVSRSHGHN